MLCVYVCCQNKLNPTIRFWKKIEPRKLTDRIAEMNLESARIKQYIVLYTYSVE